MWEQPVSKGGLRNLCASESLATGLEVRTNLMYYARNGLKTLKTLAQSNVERNGHFQKYGQNTERPGACSILQSV